MRVAQYRRVLRGSPNDTPSERIRAGYAHGCRAGAERTSEKADFAESSVDEVLKKKILRSPYPASCIAPVWYPRSGRGSTELRSFTMLLAAPFFHHLHRRDLRSSFATATKSYAPARGRLSRLKPGLGR